MWAVLALLVVATPARVPAQAAVPNMPDAYAVLDYLNQAIDWHRHLLVEQQLATDPADVLFLDDAQQLANQVLQLSFDFAKADAELLAKQKSPAPSDQGPQPSGPRSLSQVAASADAEVRQRQSELQSLKAQLATASGRKRQQLQSQIDATQSALELEQTRSQAIHDISQFVGARGDAAQGNLLAQIEELQRSVPGLEPNRSSTPPAPATVRPTNTTVPAQQAKPSGMIGLLEDLFALHHKARTLDQAIEATDSLSHAAEKLRAPLVASLTSIAQQGEQAVQQANSSGPSQLEAEKAQLDTLTAQFKQLSSVTLPLAKQSILLDGYKRNLQRWRSTVDSQSDLDLKRLLLQLAMLGIVVGVLMVLAEIWRKAIFRYVRDVRRRYQLLLVRRIVIWIAVGTAVAFSLASQIGSLATFVGLITAGIAVALQNVIMAVAGYFFLIGKYGVRVGDRVQIGGVTGDVIDIGMVRLHLMEVGDATTGRQPTGRVVVFSNAVVFQPGASFYKQIPGTNFAWHQVSLTLAPSTDYHLAEERMLQAVQSVYADYQQHIEQQHRHMQQTLSVSVGVPRPHSRLQFTDGGLMVIIRYPTELDNAAQIDDQVTRRVLDAIEQSPKLKLVGSGTPQIQPVTDAPEPHPKAS